MLKSFYFVCLPFLLILTDYARCDPDYLFNLEAGGWLKLYTTPETWEEAFVTCHHNGAVLASPLNKGLSDALQLQMEQFGVNDKIFLGTHDLYSKGYYVSLEGVPLSDMIIKWKSQGNKVGSGDCLTMSVDGRAHYSSCTDPLPFICYRKFDNQTMNECGTLDNKYSLDQRTGSCYKVHRGSVSWARAYRLCESEGGHLVVLNNAEEASVIMEMFPEDVDQYSRFHVGFGAWGRERVWTTIDGQRLDDVYNNWCPTQPDNLNGIQNRGALLKNGYIDDIGNEQLPFVCEKSPKSKRFEPLPPCMQVLKSLCFFSLSV